MAKESSVLKQSLLEKIVPVLLVLSIGLAFVVGMLWQKVSNLEKGKTGSGATNTTTTTGTEQNKPIVTMDTIKGLFNKDLIKFGDANKKLIFVEMADPSCPYCHIADGFNAELAKSAGSQFQYVSDGGSYIPPGPEMQKLVNDGKASYVYIYFPGHGNGELAMKALYCANEKGKFWEVRDLLMTNAGYELMNTTVKNDVTKAGTVADFLKGVIDSSFLKSCIESDKYNSRLDSEAELAVSLGLQGTPSFYVNTTNFAGAYSFSDMKGLVDASLK